MLSEEEKKLLIIFKAQVEKEETEYFSVNAYTQLLYDSHKTVLKLMKQLGLQCFVRIKKYKSYKGEVGKICDNLLNREFTATNPNEKWVTDVTEFKVHNEKLYLSPIVDLFNGEVISFNLSRHPVFAQVVDMLEKAFSKIPDNTNLILHSDQGVHYTHPKYRNLLKENTAAPVILCIGSDLSVGDSLGPLCGTMLSERTGADIFVYGTLKKTVTAKEVRYMSEFFIHLLLCLAVCFRSCGGILVYANVVPAFEVSGKTVLRQRHIQAEIYAGFEVVVIGVYVGVLRGDVIEKPLSLTSRKEIADKFQGVVAPQIYLRFAVCL